MIGAWARPLVDEATIGPLPDCDGRQAEAVFEHSRRWDA
jgi:hypothetical protein